MTEAGNNHLIRRQKNKENPYAQIDKKLINDERLSFKATGILTYILSKPEDWVIYQSDLIKRKSDGRKSFLSGWEELKKYGYIHIQSFRDERGRIKGWETIVFESPLDNPFYQEKQGEKPESHNGHSGENNEEKSPESHNGNSGENKPDTRIPFSRLWETENVGKEHLLINDLNNNDLNKDHDLDNDIDIGGDSNILSEIDSYKLPKRLKKWIKEKIEKDGGLRGDISLDEFEEFYATSPYVNAEADKLNFNFVNDIEFTQIVKRIYMLEENIDHLQPLLKTWVLNKMGYKRDEAVLYYRTAD